ncbi:ribosome biogenesis protein SLX9-domain-containing protein [Aspergillus ambiguus]|uniref:FAM207/SLX9 family protein n=1 Tax=Aspergillus ambiguus TaxID=176160 RepID=UPI003CCE2E26
MWAVNLGNWDTVRSLSLLGLVRASARKKSPAESDRHYREFSGLLSIRRSRESLLSFSSVIPTSPGHPSNGKQPSAFYLTWMIPSELTELQAPIKAAKKTQVAGKGTLPSSKSGLFDDAFRTTKKDKRTIKHSSFVSKIEKSSQKTTKRRRASKKLATNLDSLADALPETETELNDPANQVNVIKQKTLKHKPGAMKRREKLEKVERDRFAKNMAQMSNIETTAAAESGNDSTSTSNRWSALRSFISQTMVQQPAFRTNK